MAAASAMQRLAWAKELWHDLDMLNQARAGVPGSLAGGSMEKRFGRIRALRRMLLGGDDAGGLDLFAVSATADALGRIYDGLDGAGKPLGAEYINRMALLLYRAAEGNETTLNSIRALRDKAGLAGGKAGRAALFQSFADKGEAMRETAQAVSPMLGRLKLMDKEAVDSVANFKTALHEISSKFTDLVVSEHKAGGLTRERFDSLNAEYEAEKAKLLLMYPDNPDGNRQEKDRIIRELGMVGHDVIYKLEKDSPVSYEQAAEWANAQTISPAAKARLKKSGYDPAYVRSDMIEFYRLCRGRIGSIRIETNGRRRASAANIDTPDVGVINMGSRFDKRVLWHEMAHHLEQDPAAQEAAQGFLQTRKKGDRPVSLRRLTGNKGFAADEKAWEDDFIHPYIGKVYQSGVTEVFSMGLESFSDPVLLAKRIAQDPEMFAFIAGFLQSEPHPLFKPMMELYRQAWGVDGRL